MDGRAARRTARTPQRARARHAHAKNVGPCSWFMMGMTHAAPRWLLMRCTVDNRLSPAHTRPALRKR
eukprot:1276200-Alexandrium_andersonii.AAC.1